MFTMGLVALAAKMAKADGVVVDREVEAFERIVEVPPSEHERVAAPVRPRQGDDRWVRGLCPPDRRRLQGRAGAARGRARRPLPHRQGRRGRARGRVRLPARHVATHFGFGDHDFDRIAARHVRRADDPYLILGADRAHERRRAEAPLPQARGREPSGPGDRPRAAAGGGQDRHRAPGRDQRRLGADRRRAEPG